MVHKPNLTIPLNNKFLKTNNKTGLLRLMKVKNKSNINEFNADLESYYPRRLKP